MTWSTCRPSRSNTLPRSADPRRAVAPLRGLGALTALDRPFAPLGDGRFGAPLPEGARETFARSPELLPLASVLEDGALLPRLGSDLRAPASAGSFEVTHQEIRFSAWDRSDCNANGRTYALFVPSTDHATQTRNALTREIAGDDRAMADLILASCAVNNTLLGNFFMQLDPVLELITAKGLSIGDDAAVIGCGNTPWAPVRLLAEGAAHVIANDLLPVRSEWDRETLETITLAIQRLAPRLSHALAARIVGAADGAATLRGLEAAGEIPFENVPIPPGSLDFAFSTSVLEHVTEPDAVYAAVSRALRPGGVVYHSIDLRDHRDFSKPLDFLELTEEQYAPAATENRLRASTHLELASAHGLRIEELRIQALKEDGQTYWVNALEDVEPGVSEARSLGFAEPFRSMDRRDLSVICVQLLAVRE